jgi:hypothetical protein
MHPLYSQSFQQLTRAGILPSKLAGAFDNVPGADLSYVSVLPLATSATVLIPALTVSGFDFPANNCRNT